MKKLIRIIRELSKNYKEVSKLTKLAIVFGVIYGFLSIPMANLNIQLIYSLMTVLVFSFLFMFE